MTQPIPMPPGWVGAQHLDVGSALEDPRFGCLQVCPCQTNGVAACSQSTRVSSFLPPFLPRSQSLIIPTRHGMAWPSRIFLLLWISLHHKIALLMVHVDPKRGSIALTSSQCRSPCQSAERWSSPIFWDRDCKEGGIAIARTGVASLLPQD